MAVTSRRHLLQTLLAAAAACGVLPSPVRAEKRTTRRRPLTRSAASPRTPTPLQAPLDAPTSDPAALKELSERILATDVLPGFSVAVVDGEREPWLYAAGWADLERRRPMTTQTVFQAASLTKPVFAAAVLTLCQEQRLTLDTPLRSGYAPDIAPSLDPQAEAINARMALSHTSGLPLKHSTEWPMPLDSAPGKQFGYSGAGYLYLQQVIEQILGGAFGTYVEQRVLSAIGMGKSSLIWTPHCDTAAAIGYDWDGAPVKETSRPKQFNAAGSLHTTPGDYLQFLCEWMGPQAGGRVGLDAVTRAQFFSPQTRLAPDLAWGLGWGLHYATQGAQFWHVGDSRGYTAYAAASPAQRRALVFMANSRHGLRAAEVFARSVLGGQDRVFTWMFETFYRGEVRAWPTPEASKR